MTDTNNQEPAIIVIRHGTDKGNQEPNNPLKYSTDHIEVQVDNGPHSNDIEYYKDWLCPNQGHAQADRLGAKLPGFIQKLGVPPVNKVISILPSPPGTSEPRTTNPLMTITPYVKAIAESTTTSIGHKLILSLYSSHDYRPKDFNGDSLIADGYSKVICWEKLGMWESASKNPDATILKQLVDKDYAALVEPQPAKGTSVYVFHGRTAPGKFKLKRYDNLPEDILACGPGEARECTLKKAADVCT